MVKIGKYRIMLINAPNEVPKQNSSNYACFPHIGIVQLGTRIQNEFGSGVEVKIADGGISNTSEIETQIERYKPNLVGISVLTPTYSEGLKIARKAKDIEARVVLGDDHAGFFPERILKNRLYVDYIITNDVGEQSFSELINALIRDKPLEGVTSLVYRKNGLTVRNPSKRHYLKEQNTRPDLELITDSLETYWKNYNSIFGHLHERPIRTITINNARGCENGAKRCTYCSISDLVINTGKPEEFWATVREYNNRYGINLFFEVFDSITANPRYINSLIESMPEDIEEKIKSREIEFMVYARALGLTKQNTVSKLKRIGVTRVNIGLDSGATEMLEALRKNKTVEETNFEAVRLLNQVGISVHGSYIAGNPGETKESLEKTVEHIRKILSEVRFSSIEFSRFIPLPNSPAWDMMVNYKNPQFYQNSREIDEELQRLGIEISLQERERISEKYRDNDLLDINELASDWFVHFTHIDEEWALSKIREIDNLLDLHKVRTGKNVG